jgi:NAD(P)-dependent dehydrogenase (short-subunit alcohol dehydrogenase family)
VTAVADLSGYGPWAVITGASSGIGRAFAERCMLRTSFRRSAVRTPRTSGNRELIHLMQNDGFFDG